MRNVPGAMDWRGLAAADDADRTRSLALMDATTLCRRAASAVRAAAEGEVRAARREALAAAHAALSDALATLEDVSHG